MLQHTTGTRLPEGRHHPLASIGAAADLGRGEVETGGEIETMKARRTGGFAKFHELVGVLSVKYSSTVGSPPKVQAACLHSSHCLHILTFFFQI
jgi:hypothetical protein